MNAEARRQRRLEVLSTILLASAAIATAWSTYQSTQWRGEQSVDYSKATAARIQSSEASTRTGQLTQVDIATFIQWVDATEADNPSLARFYRERFRDEFRPAFDAWMETHPLTDPTAPKTPFAMPQYRVAEATLSSRLNTAAGVHADAAEEANRHANNYMLAVVLFATALFFAGISTKLGLPHQQEAILAFGCVVFIGTVVWVAFSPITISV